MTSYNYYNGFIIKETVKASVDTDEIITRKIDSASYTSTTGKINLSNPINADLKDETHILNDTIKTKNINCSTIQTEILNANNVSDLNTLNTDNLTVKSINATSGTITTSPTNNNDITNKSYVDSKIISSAISDYVVYDNSTNYLKNQLNNSNIETIKTSNLFTDNINKSPVIIKVSTTGNYGTYNKNTTIYKSIIGNNIKIIFNKNTRLNSHDAVSYIPMASNGMILDFENLSDVYEYLPTEFYLTGQASTYGGSGNISQQTIKFVKSTDYKYQIQYNNKIFAMNIFDLKQSIKNTDTIIDCYTETSKISNLTVDNAIINNGSCSSQPTDNYSLVNKDYTDKNFISYDSSTSKLKLNNNNIENLDIQTANINNGSISGTLTTENLNITVGNITTSPTEDNNIVNKSYVDNAISSINDNISGENTKFIKFDDQTKTLKQNNQTLENINIKNITGETINSTNSTLTGLLTTEQANINQGAIIELNASTAEIGEAEVSGNITSNTAEITKTLKVKDIECENISISKQFNPYNNVFNIFSSRPSEITGISNSSEADAGVSVLKIITNSIFYMKIDLFLTKPLKANSSTIIFKDILIPGLEKILISYNLNVNEYFETGNVSIVYGEIKNGSGDGKFNIEIRGSNSGDTIYKITIEPIILQDYNPKS